jgi:hypothetical protein
VFNPNILSQLLHLHRLLRIRTALLPLLRNPQIVQRIHACHNITRQPHRPRPISLLLQPGRRLKLPDPRHIRVRQIVQQHVESVSELATYGQVLDDWVRGFGVGCYGGELEVLDEFCQAHGFAHGAEVLFHAIEGVDGALRVVGAQRVPGQEAGEVLDCAEGFVAADLGVLEYGWYVEVMRWWIQGGRVGC